MARRGWAKARQGKDFFMENKMFKLDFTNIDGVPTIVIAASLTTQAQVSAVADQLAKLMQLLPEAKAKRKAKKPRATRMPETAQAKL